MLKAFKSDERVRYFLGDVRDIDRLERAFNSVDYVIHAAALKQVPALEYNPIEAIRTNILGTQNVINAAIDTGVHKVIVLSTDKAVNPINLYGATKLCAEKLAIASNAYTQKKRTMLSVVRYGNVIGSRGSVLELFRGQQAAGEPFTITHPEMTRFWVSVEEAVHFVLSRIEDMQGGEIFIPKLERKKIWDLALELDPEHPRTFIGIRCGEKLHETLINWDESAYAEDRDSYYIIRRQGQGVINKSQFTYSSN